MSEKKEALVVTLEAEAGKRWNATTKDGAIGTYRPGAGRRSPFHMVFMPRGVEIGKSYRVELIEILDANGEPKPDRGGHSMYRAKPAPVEYTQRWKDNGDGTVSRVTISTDWTLVEAEEGVIEGPRAKARKDGEPSTSASHKIIWGTDLASSHVEETQTIRTPELEEEVASDGTLSWKTLQRREEVQPATTEVVSAYVTRTWGTWYQNRLAETYEGSWSVELEIATETSVGEVRRSFSFTWGDLPEFMKNELEGRFPVCGCGEARYASETDSWCASCKPYRAAEEKIRREVPSEQLKRLVEQSTTLNDATVIDCAADPEGGLEIALSAMLGHLDRDHVYWDRLVRVWTGYRYLYRCPDGTLWGSKFDPATISLYEHASLAGGDGLVRLVAWLYDGHKNKSANTPPRDDFYLKTQVEGQKDVSLPLFHEPHRLGGHSLADKLRGSDAELAEVLKALAQCIEVLGEDDSVTRELRESLYDTNQDFVHSITLATSAKKELAKARDRERAIASGELIPSVSVSHYRSNNGRAQARAWVISRDGNARTENSGVFTDVYTSDLVVSHGTSDYAFRYTEDWTVERLPEEVTEAQRQAFRGLLEGERRFFTGTLADWDLSRKGKIVIATAYSRNFRGEEDAAHREMCSSFPIDLSSWLVRDVLEGLDREMETRFEVWHEKSEAHVSLRALRKEKEARNAARKSVQSESFADGAIWRIRFAKTTFVHKITKAEMESWNFQVGGRRLILDGRDLAENGPPSDGFYFVKVTGHGPKGTSVFVTRIAFDDPTLDDRIQKLEKQVEPRIPVVTAVRNDGRSVDSAGDPTLGTMAAAFAKMKKKGE